MGNQMNISAHFTLKEAMASHAARLRGIDNTPPADVIPRLKYVAETILEPIRARYGVPLVYDGGNSWYRCKALNRAIGGAKNSQHMTGEAVDIEVRGVSNIALAHWVKDTLPFDQLILENYSGTPSSGWVHVSAINGWGRGEVLTYSRGKYVSDLPILEG